LNYLELTNKALEEAGVDLDPLTSATFANPLPSKMYTKMKNWVKDAWEDIQLENNELEFTKGIATVRIYPALLFQDGSRVNEPATGDTGTWDLGDVSLTFQSVTTSEGDWAVDTAYGTMYFTTLEDTSTFNLLDTFSETDGPNEGTLDDGSFVFKYWGRYDLREFVDDLEEANFRTFEIEDNDNSSKYKLEFVPWAIWKDQYEFSDNRRGMPVYFTETPDGKIDFSPRPDKDYVITFSYTKQLQTLSAYTDEPVMDSRYHGAIVWQAVMYYANYDRQNDLWSRANKRLIKFLYAIDRDLGPEVNFGSSQFDR
jgi:hypothetical protein